MRLVPPDYYSHSSVTWGGGYPFWPHLCAGWKVMNLEQNYGRRKTLKSDEQISLDLNKKLGICR